MRFIASAAALIAVGLFGAGSAAAAPPPNDLFADATVVSSTPFADTVDLTEATLEAAEPAWCATNARTSAWYRLSPDSTHEYRASLDLAEGGTSATIYRADGPGLEGLTALECLYWWRPATDFVAEAGSTYYVQSFTDSWSTGTTAHLRVNILTPPTNDDISNAIAFAGVPFEADLDTSGASVEPGEPPLCTFAPSERTIWYRFTAAETESVMASAGDSWAGIAAYSGSPGSLELLYCGTGSRSTFRVTAGATYYLQVGQYGSNTLTSHFVLDVAPDPIPGMASYPERPSSIDLVQFSDWSSDPAGRGVASRTWDFGDGTSATGDTVTHRFGSDGLYTVALTIVTPDGRTAVTTRTIEVRTHDVAVTQFEVPKAARAGRTKTMTVSVANRRADETVTVNLYRSVGGSSFEQIGQLTLLVPARPRRATPFTFSYTFTAADAAIGKVTFRASASISGERDAIPVDNELTARPTLVS